jgi:ankyrin repeat protein
MGKLTDATQRNDIQEVQRLLSAEYKGNYLIDEERNQAGACAVHIAVFLGFSNILQVLLQAGAKINQTLVGGETPLYLAVQENRIEIVRLLIKEKADVNLQKTDGATPLFCASQENRVDIMRLLIKDGKANVNQAMIDTITPLHIAAIRGNIEAVYILIKEGKSNINLQEKNGATPIYYAVQENKIEIVRLLIKEKADVNLQTTNGETPLFIAATQGFLDYIVLLVQAGADVNLKRTDGATPLYIAAQNGHVKTVLTLCNFGAINSSMEFLKTNAFHVAAEHGHKPVIEVLIGKDKNRLNNINQKAIDGSTPLYLATSNNHIKIIKLLIKANADANQCKDGGLIALHVAAFNGEENIFKALVIKSNINAQTVSGRTAAHIAAEEGHASVISILIQAEADFNLTTMDGKTPFCIAIKKKHFDIIDLLESSEKKLNLSITKAVLKRKTKNIMLFSNIQNIPHTDFLREIQTEREVVSKKISEIFKDAMRAKAGYKKSLVAGDTLKKHIELTEETLKFFEGKNKEDYELELGRLRLMIRNINKDIGSLDSDYNEKCVEINKKISFDTLKLFAEKQYKKFVDGLNSLKDDELIKIAMSVTISAYVLQIKTDNYRKKLNLEEYNILHYWQGFSEVSVLFRVAKMVGFKLSDGNSTLSTYFNDLEKRLDDFQEILTPGRLAIKEKKYARKKFDHLKIYRDSCVMQVVLRLLDKQKSAEENSLDNCVKNIEFFFEITEGDSNQIFHDFFKFEKIKEIYQLVILFLKEKHFIESNKKSIRELEWVPTEKGNFSYDKKLNPYFEINSELFKTNIYMTANEIFSFVEAIAEQHYQDHSDLINFEKTTISFATALRANAPPVIDKDECKDHFIPHQDDKLVKKIKGSGGITIFYGEWEIWLRADRYAVILSGHKQDSGFYNVEKCKHTYDAMKEGVTRDYPKGSVKKFTKDIRIFLEESGKKIKSKGHEYDRARFAVAKFVSEPARNWKIWLVNLMLLDFIEDEKITWEEFFEIHPMRGGSDTEDKKEDQINEEIKIIVINWLRMYWPNNDFIRLTDKPDEHYRLNNPEEISSIEEYYREKIIMLLLQKRMYSLKKWDFDFSIQEYVSPIQKRLEPYRMAGDVVFPELSNYKHQLKQYVLDTWEMDDQIKLLMLFEENLENKLKYLKEDSNLYQLFAIKLKSLSAAQEKLRVVLMPRLHNIQSLVRELLISRLFIDAFQSIQEQMIENHIYGRHLEYTKAISFYEKKIHADIQSVINGDKRDIISSEIDSNSVPLVRSSVTEQRDGRKLRNNMPVPSEIISTSLRSNLFDEKIVKELSQILMQLEAENISKESDNRSGRLVSSNEPSLPIISPMPRIPVEGPRLQAEVAAFEEGKPKFEKLLTDKNLVATYVSGQGLNCFIYSLLQHVTGRYDLRSFDENLIRVIKETAGLDPSSIEMRYDDTEDSLKLVKAINGIYGINLEVRSVQINNEGQPIILSPLFDSGISGRRQPVILWLQVNHYVAVTSLSLSVRMTEQVTIGEGDTIRAEQQQLIQQGGHKETDRESKARTEGKTARRLGSSTPMLDMNQGTAPVTPFQTRAELEEALAQFQTDDIARLKTGGRS